MARNMNFGFGLMVPDKTMIRKFRWLFKIPGVSDDGDSIVDILPPFSFARPTISFKEETVQHLSETIYYPMKSEFKPLDLVLYDTTCNRNNPVFEWISTLYDPSEGSYDFIINNENAPEKNIKKDAVLEMYNGCGEIMETWNYDNCYPISADFDTVEMASSEVLMVKVSLRFDRAWRVRTDRRQ